MLASFSKLEPRLVSTGVPQHTNGTLESMEEKHSVHSRVEFPKVGRANVYKEVAARG